MQIATMYSQSPMPLMNSPRRSLVSVRLLSSCRYTPRPAIQSSITFEVQSDVPGAAWHWMDDALGFVSSARGGRRARQDQTAGHRADDRLFPSERSDDDNGNDRDDGADDERRGCLAGRLCSNDPRHIGG